MKCETCKAKMKNTTTKTEITVKDKTITVINVASLTCPECNRSIIPDSILKRVHGYAADLKGDIDTLDFAKEEADATAAAAVAASVVV